MTDWNKLKVPELKAELKNRGLSQVGLKAALVARLTASDNESGFESEATVQGDSTEVPLNSKSSTINTSESGPTSVESHDEAKSKATAIPQATESQTNAAIAAEDVSKDSSESPQISASEDLTRPDLPATNRQGIIEDKHKRKRRSQSPPPSAIDTPRKRARQDDALHSFAIADPDIGVSQKEEITSMDDASCVLRHGGADSTLPIVENTDAIPTDDTGRSLPDVSTKEERVAESGESGEAVNGTTKNNNRLLPSTSDEKPSTKDSRFRDLLPGQATSNQITSSDNFGPNTKYSSAIDIDSDRIVAPSIHPATSALYIRDFMRPLNAVTLKEHLIDLATPPGATPNPEIIVDFYLDPFRTHAFITFTNVSAASRVRSELHNKIWPEERTRKPLWVDFIPPETVPEWIADEQPPSGGSRSSGKKWEVVYDGVADGNVTATLQEVGTFMPLVRNPSISTAPTAAPRSGIEGAPSGPRAQQNSGSRATANQRPLDQLFKSTSVSPVLYYQPVSRELASRRLENIDKATSRNYSPRAIGTEINRYTFEDRDVLVDRGPEIFSGIRPPPGYRSRRGGGVGGGGVYRGRRDRYENSWGDGRDPRARRY